ncbi:PREDICTED: zinc finger protein 624-like [Vollenhovia emeryi]|uniref:zinc finger protein 624-like n=1 Tax=Vollenhovia emeryi TaxID=411798 RepID=UPI0005F3C9F3|nr:PREDICTED: zinc finger protein 624-like [Vollenhovia emeryi]XP_011861997.1 PREDICTED: zinc finger protein 624-like [Vollenhovia emeryi]XP_011861999.1 PREDICTED: zinc finger protein 624-like [Vollenhovia emeryi]
MNSKVDQFANIVNVSHKKLQVCRLCGEKSSHYIPIFEDKDNYISEKISRCLPIIIFPNDNLPSNVCGHCLNYLNTSYELILTAVEADKRLRMQLDEEQKNAIFTDRNVVAPCEELKISNVTNIRPPSIKELKRRAIIGPVKCDMCNLDFQNLDTFDDHMEQFHFFKWRCHLCDNSFNEFNKLIVHKASKHNSNVAICNIRQYTIDQNKQDNTEKSVENNQNDQQDIIHTSENIHYNQIKTEVIHDNSVQNDESNEQEMIVENIQNNPKMEQEIINENSYEQVVTMKNNEIAGSINFEMDFRNDILEIKNNCNLTQASMKRTNRRSDLNKVVKEQKRVWLPLKTTQHKRVWLSLKTPQQKKDQLFCDSCKIRFGDERHFEAHNKIHEERVMACTICSTECSSVYNLFLHKREKHNMYKKTQLKYTCDKCGQFFTHGWHWQNHNENKCSKMVDKCCKYCNTVFSTRLKLIRHLRKHKWEMFSDPTVTVYKCVACPKIFVDKEFYEKHRNVHDPECWDKFRCDVCNRPFRDKFRLREHQLSIHQNIKPHQCNICGRSFVRLHNMKVHCKIHFENKCDHCNAVFKKRLDLIKHVREIHGLKLSDKRRAKRDYICKFCGKKLSTHQSLMNHERIHTGEMPYSCPICHRPFRSYISRWTHIQRHQKGTFVCEHCGKCFSYKQNLIVHIATHLPVEARKYQCNICEKKFLRSSHLAIHKRIHSGIRPFKCDVCSLSFTQKGDMKRHRARRHLSEKTNL